MKHFYKIISLLLCAVLLMGLVPAASAATQAAVQITGIKTAGFTVENFSGNTKYYLCYPKSFSGIKFTEIKTNISANVNIKVERYCDCDYQLSYKENQELYLGYGRARVTVTVTSKTDANNKASYLFAFTDPNQDNYRYRYFKTNTSVYTTTTASSSNLIATIKKGTTSSSMPLCIAVSGSWTQIVIPSSSTNHHGKIGWVKTENLVDEYTTTALPYSYKAQIDALKKAHPNWTFEYRHLGVDIHTYAERIATLYKSSTGKSISVSTVLENMNPKNFLDDKNVFMFLDMLRFDEQSYTEKGIRALWSEKSGAVCTENEAVKYFTQAGKSLRVNSYYLLARAVLESGHGTSSLSKGKVGTDGKLYYNFYGIKAYDKNPSTGAVYAEQRGWDTPFRSIVEGANWITDQYLQRGQNTPYFFRYYPYKDHLYMSDLEAPKKDAQNVYQCYSGAGKLNSALHFIIPVFDGVGYSDVSDESWYYDDVYRATEYGLFSGMGGGKFQPEGNLTRAQFVTVLAQMSGADVSAYKGSTKFKDVVSGAWYAKYVEWGYKTGVAHGISETEFAPNQSISRQELCTMLARFATAKGHKMKTAALTFTDKAEIADWALDGVQKCVGSKLVSGITTNTFAPHNNATRAQGARILSLYYEAYMLKK